MRRFQDCCAGFSLVEVTIALGIAAVSLIAIYGLLPVGAQTNANAAAETTAVNIIAALTADMRATPNASSTSGQYHITFAAPQTLYFDEFGRVDTKLTLTSKYRADIAYPATTGLSRAPIYVKLAVSWPAQANPANAAGRVQLFAAFDRH